MEIAIAIFTIILGILLFIDSRKKWFRISVIIFIVLTGVFSLLNELKEKINNDQTNKKQLSLLTKNLNKSDSLVLKLEELHSFSQNSKFPLNTTKVHTKLLYRLDSTAMIKLYKYQDPHTVFTKYFDKQEIDDIFQTEFGQSIDKVLRLKCKCMFTVFQLPIKKDYCRIYSNKEISKQYFSIGGKGLIVNTLQDDFYIDKSRSFNFNTMFDLKNKHVIITIHASIHDSSIVKDCELIDVIGLYANEDKSPMLIIPSWDFVKSTYPSNSIVYFQTTTNFNLTYDVTINDSVYNSFLSNSSRFRRWSNFYEIWDNDLKQPTYTF